MYIYIHIYLSFPIFKFSSCIPKSIPDDHHHLWVTGTLPPCKRVPNCPEGTKRLVLLEPAEIAEIGWCRLRRPKPRGEESWTRGSWDVSFFTQAPQPKSHFWEFRRIYGLVIRGWAIIFLEWPSCELDPYGIIISHIMIAGLILDWCQEWCQSIIGKKDLKKVTHHYKTISPQASLL